MKKIFIAITLISILFGCSAPTKKEVNEEQKTDKNVLFIIVDDLKTSLGYRAKPGRAFFSTPMPSDATQTAGGL